MAGLRQAFRGAASADERVALETMMPGYVLRIEPEQLDLTRFHELVTLGRARLAAGDWAAASRRLREALALWRGPALADVADGVTWPELAVLRGTRLAVYEDCFQAELALGRDGELVDELETLLETEPTRERLVAQLMVALYNCGRQPEALARYRRARDVLAHRFGLEPGRGLQRLQQAILSHDPALALQLVGTGPATAVTPPRALAPTRAAAPAPAPVPVQPPPPAQPPPPPAPRPAAAPGPAKPARPYRASWERVECRQASVVMVRTRWTTPDGHAPSSGRIDHAVKELTGAVQEEAAPYGGLVRRAFGSVWVIVFGAPRAHEDDPERAVRAAFALRRRLTPLTAGPGDGERPAVHLAVGTGEIVVTYDDSAPEPVEVTGEVLDSCHQWLLQVPAGQIWACEATAAAVGPLFDAARVAGVPGVRRLSTGRPHAAPPAARPPFLERTRELEMLRGAYQDAALRRLPHLVTVLGEPGIGKTRLIEEFTETLRTGEPQDGTGGVPRVLHAATPAFDAHTPYEPLAGLIRGCVGVRPGAAGALVLPALTEMVARLLPDAPDADRVVAALAACLGLPTPATSPEGPGGGHEAVPREEVLDAVRRVLEETAAERPLVAVLDDFHRAADFVRSFVEDLTVRLGPVGLLLVVGARSELLRASPGWGCAKRRSALVTVAPLSGLATHALIEATAGRRQDPADDPGALADGNPLFVQEYARAGTADVRRRPAHPPAVRAVTAAQLDTLDATAKSVLRDAAVVGETLWRSAVAAVSLRESEEVSGALEYLEMRDLLRRVHRSSIPGDLEYTFRYPVTRDVVLGQLPGRVLLERHLRVANWASLLDSVRPDLLAHHHDRAITLAEADGAPVEALDRQAWEALVAASARAAAAGDDARAARCLDYALDRCPPGEPERVWLLTHRGRILDSLAERGPRGGAALRTAGRTG
ncbi:BTAD domain-containing putative transcriptional regulator [Streptomyces ziwulingensis]|uniref:BTAD domain-containing putative transcriptional regulator n=1 Tax=Streptomyces ziwulingensis TaxID=1045501 RepID=UPI0031EE3C6D